MRAYVRRIGFFWDVRTPAAERADRLVAVGMLGWARIDGVRDTGLAAGDTAALIFDLTIDVRGRGRYRAAHAQVVAGRGLNGLRPGAKVPVLVDPEDPTELLTPWRTPTGPRRRGGA